jgi:hypothetical protein
MSVAASSLGRVGAAARIKSMFVDFGLMKFPISSMLIPPILACAVAVLAGQLGYLVFHLLAELFAIIIGFTVLVVALAARLFSRNHLIVFVALLMAWVSGIDLVHTMAYEGMHLLPFDGSNTAIQLWLVARSIQAVGLLLAPMYFKRPLRLWMACLVLSVVTLGAAAAMAWGVFPQAYVPGVGLTPFKIYAEYAIIAVLMLAALRLYVHRQGLASTVWLALMGMMVLTIASEFAFTRYVSAYGQANLVGHLLKILAFWALYLALIDVSLKRPFDTLAKTVSSFDALPDPIITVADDRCILQANRAAAVWAGAAQDHLVGKDSHALFHDVHVRPDDCPVCAAMSGPRAASGQRIALTTKHGTRHLECTLTTGPEDGHGRVHIQILREQSPPLA